MYDRKAIEKCYAAAEFWGYPMEWASEYVENHLDDFRIKPKEIIINVVLHSSGGKANE